MRLPLLFSVMAIGCAGAVSVTAQPRVFPLDSAGGLQLNRVLASPAAFKGRKALRVTEPAGQSGGREDRLAILKGTQFRNGVIEVHVAGQPGAGAMAAARGFVGIAFRVAPDLSKYECFYLRPTNGRAEDQVRRNHSAQYIAFPDFPWPRLRKEFPEMYESYVDLAPGEWTKVKIVVNGVKARLYVHGNDQPTLIVNDLKHGESAGAVALWVGPGTEAHFTNLRLGN